MTDPDQSTPEETDAAVDVTRIVSNAGTQDAGSQDAGSQDAGLRGAMPEVGDRRLGPFRLIRELGQGGMGVVYEAEEDEPRRLIALKVLRTGFDTQEARARLEREAQVLGTLSHPGIATLYGAGTHTEPSGTRVPYLVMELVHGARPITEFADRQALSTEARLRLFLDVAAAVAAGHQRGIIHRDLKPANVLVDEEGRPKIIDFGIARVTTDEVDLETLTRTGIVMGTLGYLAPEQLGRGGAGDDVRMDVYALGVILYELLTGQPPLSLDGLDMLEAVRTILEHRPRPPTRFVPGMAQDLVLILGKALAKDPDQRYGSVDALARDLSSYLANEPILARAPSWTYRLRLFTRRNRVGVIAAACILLSLVGATFISLRAAAREAAQRRVAEAAERDAVKASKRAVGLLVSSQEMVQGLMTDHYRRLAQIPGTLPARLALVRQLEEGTQSLRPHAEDDAQFLRTAGHVHLTVGMLNYQNGGDHLGRPQAARAAFSRAEEAFSLLRGRTDVAPELAVQDRMHQAIAIALASDALAYEGRSAEAEDRARRSVAMLAALFERHPASMPVRNNLALGTTGLARLAQTRGDREEALAHLQRTVALLPSKAPPDRRDAEVAYGTRGFAEALWGQMLRIEGRLDEARPHLVASLEAFEAGLALAPDDPSKAAKLSQAHGELGVLALGAGDLVEARRHLEQAVALGRERCAKNPQDRRGLQSLAVDLTRLADLHEAAERREEAIGIMRESIGISRTLAAEHSEVLFLQLEYRIALNRWGGLLNRHGDAEGAAEAFEEAHALAERLLGEHPQETRARVGWGEALDALGIVRWMAARGKPTAMRRALLLEARQLFKDSVKVFEDLEKDGLLPGTHKGVGAQIAGKIDICAQGLAALDGSD